MDLGLSDRIYVVSGAPTGLGRACAQQLAAEGARLVLSGRDEAALEVTARGLGGNERAIAVSGDLAEPGFETCLTAAAVARYGRLDGALICVEETEPGAAAETTDEAWRTAFEAIVLGPLRLARSVGRNTSNEGASVLFLLPVTARATLPGRATTTGLTPVLVRTASTLAAELGVRNVRVNALVVGYQDGDVAPARAAGADPAEPAGPAGAESPAPDPFPVTPDAVPLRRPGDPFEFARPAVFLLSPAASYVTGSVLAADGGLTRCS